MPLLKQLLRDKRLVAPFRKSIASPRSYYLVRSGTAARKPEVQEFADWLRAEALTAIDPGSSARADRAPA
jgi:LysR family glycine cleavage system transcriptional activator